MPTSSASRPGWWGYPTPCANAMPGSAAGAPRTSDGRPGRGSSRVLRQRLAGPGGRGRPGGGGGRVGGARVDEDRDPGDGAGGGRGGGPPRGGGHAGAGGSGHRHPRDGQVDGGWH